MYTQKEPVAHTPAWPHPLLWPITSSLQPHTIYIYIYIYIRLILILPSHLHQGFTVGFVPSGSGTKIFYLL